MKVARLLHRRSDIHLIHYRLPADSYPHCRLTSGASKIFLNQLVRLRVVVLAEILRALDQIRSCSNALLVIQLVFFFLIRLHELSKLVKKSLHPVVLQILSRTSTINLSSNPLRIYSPA